MVFCFIFYFFVIWVSIVQSNFGAVKNRKMADLENMETRLRMPVHAQWTCTVIAVSSIELLELITTLYLGTHCWHLHAVTHTPFSAAFMCVFVCVSTHFPLENNSCWAWAVIAHTPPITHWHAHVLLYLPVCIIRQDSSLYNLHSDIIWVILEVAQAPPACVFKLLVRNGARCVGGWGAL